MERSSPAQSDGESSPELGLELPPGLHTFLVRMWHVWDWTPQS